MIDVCTSQSDYRFADIAVLISQCAHPRLSLKSSQETVSIWNEIKLYLTSIYFGFHLQRIYIFYSHLSIMMSSRLALRQVEVIRCLCRRKGSLRLCDHQFQFPSRVSLYHMCQFSMQLDLVLFLLTQHPVYFQFYSLAKGTSSRVAQWIITCNTAAFQDHDNHSELLQFCSKLARRFT